MFTDIDTEGYPSSETFTFSCFRPLLTTSFQCIRPATCGLLAVGLEIEHDRCSYGRTKLLVC